MLRLELLPRPLLERNGDAVPLRAARSSAEALDDYGYVNEWASFMDDRDKARRPFMDATFGRTVLEVLVAAADAAGRATTVPLPYTGRRDLTPAQLWRGGGAG